VRQRASSNFPPPRGAGGGNFNRKERKGRRERRGLGKRRRQNRTSSWLSATRLRSPGRPSSGRPDLSAIARRATAEGERGDGRRSNRPAGTGRRDRPWHGAPGLPLPRWERDGVRVNPGAPGCGDPLSPSPYPLPQGERERRGRGARLRLRLRRGRGEKEAASLWVAARFLLYVMRPPNRWGLRLLAFSAEEEAQAAETQQGERRRLGGEAHFAKPHIIMAPVARVGDLDRLHVGNFGKSEVIRVGLPTCIWSGRRTTRRCPCRSCRCQSST